MLIARANRLKPIALPFSARKPLITLSAVVAALWCSVSISNAATLTWTGAGGTTDWFYPANWGQTVVPPRPPVAGDIIYIGTNTAGAASDGTVVMGPGSGAGNTLYLGYTPGTTGDLTVQQGGSLTLSSTLTLGQQGTGTLNIDGGSVTASKINIGYFSGTVTGLGVLQITNGGVLTTTSGSANYVSYTPTAATTVSAPSTVLIDGEHSAWYASSTVTLGAGSGASFATLTVQNGGLLYIGGNLGSNYGLELASGVTSTADVTITGPGSTINSTPGIFVGGGGTANVSVLNGGTLLTSSAVNDYDYIGQNTTLAGDRSVGHVVVDGAGSSWTSNVGIAVGYTGIGTLTISNGATVTNTSDSYIGATRGTSGGTDALYAVHGEVLITGAGSIWTTGTLDIAAQSGAEGILTVADGGILKTTDSYGVHVGNDGLGVINIGAPVDQAPAAPGYIDTSDIHLISAANSVINFNHTATDADNYTFSPPLSGNGTVNALSGVTVLTGVGSDYSGTTTVYDGAVLAAGAANVFSPNSDYFLQDPGTLDLRGSSQTVGSVTNAGVVNMGTGTAPGTMLIVNGNYVGNGGIIVFNTKLGDDSSPTDKMIVNGATSGQTGIQVVNAGGLGAQTAGNGIELVHVTNGIADSAGTFSLVGQVSAGAYNYSLFQNGVSDTDGNWYLRSTGMRHEVAIASGIGSSVALGGLQLMGDATDHGGIAYKGNGFVSFCGNGTQPAAESQCHDTMMWGRVFGEYGNQGGGSSGADGTSAYDYGIYGIQTGADLYRTESNKAGVYFSYGRMDSTIRGIDGGRAGGLEYDAYAIGGYWTHLYGGGWYTDVALQGAWYENLRSTTNGVGVFSTHGTSITAQGEAGKWIGLGDGWAIIPKAGLVYQSVDISDGSDGVALISFGTTNELYGRIGTRVTKDLAMSNPRAMQVYGELNVWDQLGDRNAKTTFTNLQGTNPTTTSSMLGGSWAQLKAGITGQVTEEVSVFVALDGNVALDHTGYAVGGRAGLKVNF